MNKSRTVHEHINVHLNSADWQESAHKIVHEQIKNSSWTISSSNAHEIVHEQNKNRSWTRMGTKVLEKFINY